MGLRKLALWMGFGGLRGRIGEHRERSAEHRLFRPDASPVRKCLIAAVLAILAAAAPANASTRVGCRSGKTVFKRPAVRVFRVARVYGNPRTAGSRYNEFYLCARGSHHPYAFWGQPFLSDESVAQYKLVGDRLGFVAFAEGVSGGAGRSIGWVQLPRGPVKEADIWDREEVPEEEEPGPKVPSEELDYAIAQDGTVVVAGEALDQAVEAEHPNEQPPAREWEVCVLSVKARRLSSPKALLKTVSPPQAPVLSSIAIDASSVSWRNQAGLAVSVPR
jgi:hypothetical protein